MTLYSYSIYAFTFTSSLPLLFSADSECDIRLYQEFVFEIFDDFGHSESLRVHVTLNRSTNYSVLSLTVCDMFIFMVYPQSPVGLIE